MKRIVLIFPYFGKLPSLYEAWRFSAIRNKTIDFMFFTDSDVKPAENIIVHKMQFSDFREIIQSIFNFPIVLDRPYILCDFKPAYGEALKTYINDYDFWGYGDIDVVYGDIRAFLTEELLNKYKFYLGYGHLTLYRNDPETNSYYRKIIPGYQDYHDSFTIHKQTFFDEYDHKGTADKWKECRPEDSWTDLCFDNISKPKQSYHFNSLTRGWKNVLFEHIGNKLFMIRINKGKVEKRESLYAHFQHRPFIKDCVNNYDHFLIIPSSIIDYPKHFVLLKLKYYSRNRILSTIYAQWKDRIIWKLHMGNIR